MGEDRVIIKSELDGEGFAKGCDKLTEAISSLDKTVKEVFGNIQKMVDAIDWEKVTESFAKGDFAGAAKEISGAMAKIREEAEKGVNQDDGKSNFFSGIKEKASDAAQAVKKAFGGIKGVMKGLGTALTVPIRLMGTLASKAKVALSGIGKAVGNVTNGLRKMLGGTKSAFSGVIGNVVRLAPMLLGAASVYQALTKSVNAYMAENEKLQQRLNSIWTALGNVIGPIIEKFVNWITTAVSYLLSFLKMLGITSKSASELSKKTSKAGAEMKKTLAGFDELNVLNDNSGGNKGGLQDVDPSEWMKKLADLLKNKMWDEAADMIVDKMNGIIDTIKNKAYDLGLAIGEYVGGALHILSKIIRDVNWEDLGEGIGRFITGLIERIQQINPYALGTILVGKFTILLRIIKGVFIGTDGNVLGTFLADTIIGALDALSDAIGDPEEWAKIGANLRAAFDALVEKWPEIKEKLFELLKKAWDAAWEAFLAFLQGDSEEELPIVAKFRRFKELVEEISTKLAPMLEELVQATAKLVGVLFEDFLGRINDVLEFINKFLDWIEKLRKKSDDARQKLSEYAETDEAKRILETFGDTFRDSAEAADLYTVKVEEAGNASEQAGKKIQEAEKAADNVGTSFSLLGGEFDGTKEAAEDAASAIGDIENRTGPSIKTTARRLAEMKDAIGEIGSGKGSIDELSESFEGASAKVEDVSEKVESASENIGKTSEAWKELGSSVDSALTEMGGNVETQYTSLADLVRSKLEGLRGDVGKVFDDIKGAVSASNNEAEKATRGSWSNIGSTISGAAENIKALATGAWDAIKGNVSGANSEIVADNSSTWSSVENSIGTSANNIKSTVETSWNSIKTSTTNALNQINTTNKSSMSQVEAAQKSSWNNVRTIATTSAQSMSSSVGGIFRSLASQAYGWGADLCANVANGIYSAYSWVTNAVSSIANTIYSYLHFSEPDKGPLANFHTFMPDMMRMMADGIKDNTHLAADAASGVAEAVSEEIQDGDFHFGVEANAEMGDFMTTFSDKIVQGFSDLISRLESLTERINFAMPTVAEGSFLPYGVGGGQNAFGASGEDGFISRLSSSIYDAVSSALMDTQGSGGQRIAVLNVNGREFCRATFYDQQAVADEHGISFINNG